MIIVRPVHPNDVDQLLALAAKTGFGLTTLPQDPHWLRRRVRDSILGFESLATGPRPADSFLFVMEDLRTGRVVGTSGIVAKVGGFEPFYAYRIETNVHESQALKVRKEIRTLHLVAEHNGPCEIGSLFLDPDYRKAGNGRLISLCRFLFMAEHPDHFDPMVIAEMRGVIDEQGQSDFWDAVGKHFFEIDFPKADYLSLLNKQFIADLMPRHPLYIPLLPESARRVIGQVHEQTKPALRILEVEGFRFSGMVDIFEAGPVVICERDRIRAVRESLKARVSEIIDAVPETPPSAVMRCAGEFRCAVTSLETADDGGVRLPAPVALALGVKIGEEVRHVAVKAAIPTDKDTR